MFFTLITVCVKSMYTHLNPSDCVVVQRLPGKFVAVEQSLHKVRHASHVILQCLKAERVNSL